MNSILYEKEITVNAIDSAYEKGKKDGGIEELENIKSEIEDLLFSYGYLDIHTNNDVLEIINKRIEELKGKNNDR